MIDFTSSCIIASHPDDEVTFFSSCIEKVTNIILVYLVDPERIYEKRIQFINQHPLKDKIIYVMMDESGCFSTRDNSGNIIDAIDWPKAKLTQYGVQLRDNLFIPKYYQNYSMIKEILDRNIHKFKTVITHNPWGESEHAEHMQVYQIVKQLQKKFEYKLYYTNYIHWPFEQSIDFANRIIKERSIHSAPIQLDINKELCKTIKSKYIEYGIWSAHPDIKWDQNYDILYEDKNDETITDDMSIRPLFGDLPIFEKKINEPDYPNIFES